MEPEAQEASAPLHGHSEGEATYSEYESQSHISSRVTENHNHARQSSKYLNRAIEQHYEVLLSRAHLLFFRFLYQDAQKEKKENPSPGNEKVLPLRDFLSEGLEIFHEAESFCMSGSYRSKQLLAKYWYVRGFLADTGGDDDSAERYFLDANSLDRNYWSLQRVRRLVQRHENDEELLDAWGEKDRPSERENVAYTPGDIDSAGDYTRPLSSASNVSKADILFRSLQAEAQKTPPQDIATKSETSTPATRSSADSTKFEEFIHKKMYGPSTPKKRKGSEETRKLLMEHENSPEKDAFVLAVARQEKSREEAEQREAIVNANYREQIDKWQNEKKISFGYRRPSRKETLLTDTPSITNQQLASALANRSAVSIGKPVLLTNSQGFRRPSLSTISSVPSSPSSPLRKSSLVGDVAEALDESPG